MQSEFKHSFPSISLIRKLCYNVHGILFDYLITINPRWAVHCRFVRLSKAQFSNCRNSHGIMKIISPQICVSLCSVNADLRICCVWLSIFIFITNRITVAFINQSPDPQKRGRFCKATSSCFSVNWIIPASRKIPYDPIFETHYLCMQRRRSLCYPIFMP